MRITKYIHSCILLEENGQKLLFDPGKFSFVESLVKPDQFDDVNYIVISHEHPDHLDLESLKQIVTKSGAQVIGNSQVAAKLQKEGIGVTVTGLEAAPQRFGYFTLQPIAAPHEAILASEIPQNTAHLVNGKLLNPGDSFHPSLLAHAGVEVLLLPVMAPWLTEVAAFEFARKMRPQHIVPIHDGYAKDFFLKQRYETYAPYFEKINIKFHPLKEPGDHISI